MSEVTRSPLCHVLAIFSGLLGLSMLLVAGGIGIVHVVPRLERAEAFDDWPEIEATVAAPERATRDRGFACVYTVHGKQHYGYRISEGLSLEAPEDKLDAGEKITIRYNPETPAQMAVRRPTEAERNLLLGLFVITPGSLALVFWILAYVFWRYGRRQKAVD